MILFRPLCDFKTTMTFSAKYFMCQIEPMTLSGVVFKCHSNSKIEIKSEKYYHRNVDYTVRIEFLSCNYSVLASRESYTSITKRNTKGQSLQLFYCDKEKIRRWLWVIFFINLWSTRSFLEELYWTLLFVSISVLPFSNWNKCKYVKHHRNWTVKNFWFFSWRTK